VSPAGWAPEVCTLGEGSEKVRYGAGFVALGRKLQTLQTLFSGQTVGNPRELHPR